MYLRFPQFFFSLLEYLYICATARKRQTHKDLTINFIHILHFFQIISLLTDSFPGSLCLSLTIFYTKFRFKNVKKLTWTLWTDSNRPIGRGGDGHGRGGDFVLIFAKLDTCEQSLAKM